MFPRCFFSQYASIALPAAVAGKGYGDVDVQVRSGNQRTFALLGEVA